MREETNKTVEQLQAELAVAVAMSNAAFEAKDWRKSKRWGERAEVVWAELRAMSIAA